MAIIIICIHISLGFGIALIIKRTGESSARFNYEKYKAELMELINKDDSSNFGGILTKINYLGNIEWVSESLSNVIIFLKEKRDLETLINILKSYEFIDISLYKKDLIGIVDNKNDYNIIKANNLLPDSIEKRLKMHILYEDYSAIDAWLANVSIVEILNIVPNLLEYQEKTPLDIRNNIFAKIILNVDNVQLVSFINSVIQSNPLIVFVNKDAKNINEVKLPVSILNNIISSKKDMSNGFVKLVLSKYIFTKSDLKEMGKEDFIYLKKMIKKSNIEINAHDLLDYYDELSNNSLSYNTAKKYFYSKHYEFDIAEISLMLSLFETNNDLKAISDAIETVKRSDLYKEDLFLLIIKICIKKDLNYDYFMNKMCNNVQNNKNIIEIINLLHSNNDINSIQKNIGMLTEANYYEKEFNCEMISICLKCNLEFSYFIDSLLMKDASSSAVEDLFKTLITNQQWKYIKKYIEERIKKDAFTSNDAEVLKKNIGNIVKVEELKDYILKNRNTNSILNKVAEKLSLEMEKQGKSNYYSLCCLREYMIENEELNNAYKYSTQIMSMKNRVFQR